VSGENGFRVIEGKAEPTSRSPRASAIGRVLQFEARDGLVALVPEALVDRLCLVSRQAEPNEWLGILVGRTGHDEHGSYVIADGVVLDQNAIATPGSVHSTDLGERRVREIATAAYPGCILLGWVHAHVRCGTRYSAGDCENQATWTAPNSIGIVCDPRTPERIGVYRGPRSERLTSIGPWSSISVSQKSQSESSIRVIPSPNRVLKPATTGIRRSSGPQTPLNRRVVIRRLVVVACAAVLLLVWRVRMLYTDLHARIEVLERTVRALDESQGECVAKPSRYEPSMSLLGDAHAQNKCPSLGSQQAQPGHER
jgi:proteasome lid subunit RPN8/RPN11